MGGGGGGANRGFLKFDFNGLRAAAGFLVPVTVFFRAAPVPAAGVRTAPFVLPFPAVLRAVAVVFMFLSLPFAALLLGLELAAAPLGGIRVNLHETESVVYWYKTLSEILLAC